MAEHLKPQTSAAQAATPGRANPRDVKLFTFLEDLAVPIKQVAVTAWTARGKLVADMRSYVVVVGGAACSMPGRGYRVVTNPKLQALMIEEEDPEALAAMTTGTGGALCLGSAGGLVGMVAGGTCGTVVGVFPALFTFGLSIPVMGIAGGAGGVLVGAATGGAAGFAGGAAAGYSVALYRMEIRRGALYVAGWVDGVYTTVVVTPATKVRNVAGFTKGKSLALGSGVKQIATNRNAQVVVASGAAGAASLGVAGAAGGTAVGAATGALVGLPMALFTFGLSIPVSMAVGGGCGLCVGVSAGATTGLVGGGVAGHVGYKYGGKGSTAVGFVRSRVAGLLGSGAAITEGGLTPSTTADSNAASDNELKY